MVEVSAEEVDLEEGEDEVEDAVVEAEDEAELSNEDIPRSTVQQARNWSTCLSSSTQTMRITPTKVIASHQRR